MYSETHVFARRDHWFRKIHKRVATAKKIKSGRQMQGGFTLYDFSYTATSHLIHAGVDLVTVRDY